MLRDSQTSFPALEADQTPQRGHGRPTRRRGPTDDDPDDEHRSKYFPLRVVRIRPLLGVPHLEAAVPPATARAEKLV